MGPTDSGLTSKPSSNELRVIDDPTAPKTTTQNSIPTIDVEIVTAELAAKPKTPKPSALEVTKAIAGSTLIGIGAGGVIALLPLGVLGAGIGFAIGKGVEKFAKNAPKDAGVAGALIGGSLGTLLSGAVVIGGCMLVKSAYSMKQDRKETANKAANIEPLGFKPQKTMVCQSGKGFVDATYENAKPENNCDLVIVNAHNGIGIVMDGAGHNSSFLATEDAPVKEAFIRTFAEHTNSKMPDTEKIKDLRTALRSQSEKQQNIMGEVRLEDRKIINQSIADGQMAAETFYLKKEIDKGEITKLRNQLNTPKYDDLDRNLMQEVLDALNADTPEQINALMNDPIRGATVKDYLKLLSSGGTAAMPAYVMIKVEEDSEAGDGTKKAIIAQDGDCCFGSYDPSTGAYAWHNENTNVNGAVVTTLNGLTKGTIIFAMSDGIPEFLPRSIIQDIVTKNSAQPDRIMSELKKAVIENDGKGVQASKLEGSVIKESHKCKKHDYLEPSQHDDISGFFLVV